jgi:hypothetical protein
MRHGRIIGLSLAAAAALVLLALFAPPARKAVFCSQIVMPYELTGSYIVFVPLAEHGEYNRAFLAFARKHRFILASDEMEIDEVGNTARAYLNLQSEACDGAAYIASSNIAHPDEFWVTFDANWLVGKRRAREIERAFLAEFGRRYRIRPEEEVARERGIRP